MTKRIVLTCAAIVMYIYIAIGYGHAWTLYRHGPKAQYGMQIGFAWPLVLLMDLGNTLGKFAALNANDVSERAQGR